MAKTSSFLLALLLFITTACKQKISSFTQSESPYRLDVQFDRIDLANCMIKQQAFCKLTAKLSNNSKDTLKYLDWYCSHAVWSTDNPKFAVYESDEPCYICDSNIIQVFEVPPHSTKKVTLALALTKSKLTSGEKFKIAMTLVNPGKVGDDSYYSDRFDGLLTENSKHRIWSEEVIVP